MGEDRLHEHDFGFDEEWSNSQWSAGRDEAGRWDADLRIERERGDFERND